MRTAVAYAAAVFALLQIGEILLPAFTTDAEALIRILIVGAVLLFPVVVMVAWVYEITPMGVRSMARVDAEAGIEPGRLGLTHRLAFLGLTVAAVGGAAAWWWTGGQGVPESLSFRTASVFQGARTTDASGPIGSLAVLPLDDLSADPGQEYFAPGMHEALVSELSQISSLRVISRTSVVQYSPAGRSTPQIGSDLGVDAIVEGSVLRAEGRVRITVQLIHAASDTHLWSESYERDVANVITLQREVAQAVAGEIRRLLQERSRAGEGTGDPRMAANDPGGSTAGEALRTGGGAAAGAAETERAEAAAPSPESLERPALDLPGMEDIGGPHDVEGVDFVHVAPEVQEAVMRGRMALLDGSEDGAERAFVIFRNALESDSAFAPALSGLAGAYLAQGFQGRVPDQARLDSARVAAERAVALDPSSPEAREILLSVQDALMVIQGSVQDVPLTAPSTPLGQFVQDGLAALEVRGEPSDERLRVRAFVRLVSGGHLSEAAEMGADLLERGVDDLVLWEGMETVLRLQSDAQGVVDLRRQRREVRGSEPGASVRALVDAMEASGAEGYWVWKRDEQEARAAQGAPFFWASLATARMALGDRAGALDALGRAAEAREPVLAALRQDPVWDPARGDERYQAVVRTLRPDGPALPPPDRRR
ncbi:MAG TPA: hypothetical protein VLA43_09220 [Longimicrobiales bacterium]|nr:hypothetical protein [Longimicrobiales bacterium]